MTSEFPGGLILGFVLVLWITLFPVMLAAQVVLCAIPGTRTRAIASVAFGVATLLFCGLAALSISLWSGASPDSSMFSAWGALV